jgi:hypothetical protein
MVNQDFVYTKVSLKLLIIQYPNILFEIVLHNDIVRLKFQITPTPLGRNEQWRCLGGGGGSASSGSRAQGAAK